MFLKRMKRKKWDRGGDGVSHHRYTSDGGRHDKRWSSESKAKLA